MNLRFQSRLSGISLPIGFADHAHEVLRVHRPNHILWPQPPGDFLTLLFTLLNWPRYYLYTIYGSSVSPFSSNRSCLDGWEKDQQPQDLEAPQLSPSQQRLLLQPCWAARSPPLYFWRGELTSMTQFLPNYVFFLDFWHWTFIKVSADFGQKLY